MKMSDIVAVVAVVGACLVLVNQVVVPRLNEAPPQTTATVPAPQQAAPQSAPQLAANAAQLKRESDGHYWANAEVDGAAVKFMVDTGASTVALTFRDAQRIGLRPETLDFKWSIRTAGGEVKGASVLLESIKIGRVEVKNVEAMILQDQLEQSLLGMTFLRELESYEFRRNNLILRK